MPADSLRSLPKTKAAFVEPMDCLPVTKLPEGSQWILGNQVGWLPSGRGEIRFSRYVVLAEQENPQQAVPLHR
jgi:hypothetical protein